MARSMKYCEAGCRENSITCIFLCEFHHTAGPKIICQAPEDHISKDDFEAVSVYIIPKAQLFRNVITITAFNLKILGYPARIDDKKYARNAYCFNLCFVFHAAARTVQYESIVKKLTNFLVFMETKDMFLSKLTSSRKNEDQLVSMLTQVMNDLNTQKVCLLKGLNVTTHLKVIQLRPDPPPIVDYQVPVLLEPVDVYQLDQWDLTSNQILLHINGVNHVKKISALANVDNNLVKSCLQNLVYYGVVAMIPVFQYSNMYSVTPKLRRLAVDKRLQDECIMAVTRAKKEPAHIRDIFFIYSNMKSGVTMKDLCTRLNPVAFNVDERNLVEFGILEGFIRRIYKYPVLLDGCPSNKIPYSQYLTGEYSTDYICCINEISYQQLENAIEIYPNVVFIYK